MRLYISLLALFTLLLGSCQPRAQQQETDPVAESAGTDIFLSEAHQAFFNHLRSLCGKSFSGTQVYRSHHGDSWADYALIMHVRDCTDALIAIPFSVRDDRSRTWLFMAEEGRLRFRHDHRHEDGTPEDETLYGGYADESGTAFAQYFPADEYTASLIDGGGGNVWTVTISDDFSLFSYRLERDGEKRFRIDFDLSTPLKTSEYE